MIFMVIYRKSYAPQRRPDPLLPGLEPRQNVLLDWGGEGRGGRDLGYLLFLGLLVGCVRNLHGLRVLDVLEMA